jgi:aspartate aminotransferase-like enzyme
MDFPKLFTVGPVYVRKEVREEMSRQMFSHRSADYAKLHGDMVGKVQRLLATKDLVLVYTSSATGIWESCARNCVEKKALACSNGEFSKRFGETIRANGKEVDFLEKPPGKGITPEELDKAIKKSKPDSVAIVHNETSTGVMNPLKDLVKVCRENHVLSMVDVVSSVAGVPIFVDDWGIDVCLFSVQKCLGVPPGLACASVGSEALERSAKAINKGYYFDMKVMEKHALKNNTLATPPIPQMFALSKSLDFIFEEGLEKVWQRHKAVSDYVKKRCTEDFGFDLFPDPKFASDTLSCISTKGTKVSAKDLLVKMKGKGYVIGSGYGEFKETTFRVGNMGNVHMADAKEMLDVMEGILKEFP